jgi:hypothetical protein
MSDDCGPKLMDPVSFRKDVPYLQWQEFVFPENTMMREVLEQVIVERVRRGDY